MKTLMIYYMIAIIYRDTKASCVALSEWYEGVSHDQFTRLLSSAQSWPTLLWRVFASRLIGEGGSLIVDDTVLEKFGSKVFGVYWVHSSRLNKAVKGINVVLLIWTDGRRRVPIGIKVWRKGGPSRVVLASKLLRWAYNLGIKPQYVLFDSWYSSKSILRQIRSYNWHFITRLSKNRKLSGKQLKYHWPHRFGHTIGKVVGGFELFVVKDSRRYLATSDLSLSLKQVKFHYGVRQQIEETIKILKSQLAWGKCPARTKVSQLAHLHLCLMAFCVLDSEAVRIQATPYQIRRSLLKQVVPLHSHLFQPFIRAA